jgi:hypothetical protein
MRLSPFVNGAVIGMVIFAVWALGQGAGDLGRIADALKRIAAALERMPR